MVDSVIKAAAVIKKGADVLTKLRESFNISKETRDLSRKCQKEIEQLQFTSFNETSSCKRTLGIPTKDFEKFIERLQARVNFPDKAKECILDGLYAAENEELVTDFQFKDGKGDIHHARFVTLKKGDTMDIAYADYSLSFKLSEKEIETTSCSWFLNVVPMPFNNVEITRKPQHLNDKEMDTFSQRCLVKLHHKVQEEWGHDTA